MNKSKNKHDSQMTDNDKLMSEAASRRVSHIVRAESPKNLLKSIKPFQKRVTYHKKIEEIQVEKVENKRQYQAVKLEDLRKEICISLINEGLIESYFEILKISYFEKFRDQYGTQEEKSELTKLRIKYSNDQDFIATVHSLFRKVEREAGDDVTQVQQAHVAIADFFLKAGDTPLAFYQATKAKKVSQSYHLEDLELHSQQQLGEIQFSMGSQDDSHQCLEKAHALAVKLHNEQFKLSISKKLCMIYKDMAYSAGVIDENSINQLDKAQKFSLSLNDKLLECQICLAQGQAYQALLNHSMALNSLQKCQDQLQQLEKETDLKAKVQASLAHSLQLLGQDTKAEENLIKLISVSEKEKHYKSLADATLNLAVIQLRQGKQKESENQIRKHQSQTEDMSDVGMVDQARVNMGVVVGEWTAKQYIRNVNQQHLLQVVTGKIQEFVYDDDE